MLCQLVRSYSKEVISSACAWWAIIPCMNWASASVYRMPDKSVAVAISMLRVGSPGAPGCTSFEDCVLVGRSETVCGGLGSTSPERHAPMDSTKNNRSRHFSKFI